MKKVVRTMNMAVGMIGMTKPTKRIGIQMMLGGMMNGERKVLRRKMNLLKRK